MRRCRSWLPLALLLLVAPSLPIYGTEPGYYRSDAIGLALAPLPGFLPREQYLLKVERLGDLELRTLYGGGKELKRWETRPGSERIFEAGLLAEERSFDRKGRTASESFYLEGRLERRVEYRYGPQGLEEAHTYDPQGALLSRERYELGPRGELRRVTREAAGAPPQSLAMTGTGGRRFEDRLASGGYELVERYDPRGRLDSSQVLRSGKPGEVLRNSYGPNLEHPRSTERSDPASSTRTVTRFDASGRLVEQVTFQGEKRVEEWSYGYDSGGHRTQATRRSAQGTEVWNYSYDDSGRLRREESRVHGELVKVTSFREDDIRIEELYREGSPFLRVTYVAGRKTREEVLSAGQVIRVREFEGSAP
jgi:antitoxin component YwqK of YwqJK toxin-antitoxin module